MADLGEAEILGVLLSCGHPHGAACIAAINAWYGRSDIPIGVVTGECVIDPSKYAEGIAREFPATVNAEDAVRVARRLLAGEEDGAVTLVTIGFMTNLHRLLQSGADDLSPLDGRTLVARKIAHWVCMGGAFPAGSEFNLRQDSLAAEEVLADWPSPVTFFGVELGFDLLTGEGLRECPANNPVRRAYELYYAGPPKHRYSWDQATVLYAVRGLKGLLDGYWGHSGDGRIVVHRDGGNEWESCPNGRHRYLVAGLDPPEISAVIEELMMKPPVLQEIAR